MASAKKAKGLFEYLEDKGVPAEDLDRVRVPAGLSLGGETLPEIALSIMAEIVQLRSSVTQPATQPAKPMLNLPVINSTSSSDASHETASEARDPVCGMTVDPARAKYKSQIEDETFYFCCVRCKESFDRSPESYRTQSAGGL